MTTASATPPPALLDRLLQVAPIDVLLFDTALVCRYAAPAADTLFGRTAAELVGRPAAAIFPPADSGLGPVLARAAQTAIAWEDHAFRYAARLDEGEQLYCWWVRVEPVATADFRGVLVTLADVGDLVQETERLRQEGRELQATVRTLLAPVVGYLQLLARRPHVLRGRPPAQVVEAVVLPRVQEIVAAVDVAAGPPPSSSAPITPDRDDAR